MSTAGAALVVMGVSGAGKTMLARAIAARADAVFIEGDDLHPPANVAKMAAGVPLDDSDRAGWLEGLRERIVETTANGTHAVATCSALKRRYRETLRRGLDRLAFVYLDIDEAEATRRVSGRAGDYMPPTLVASQFAALESPRDEPRVLSLDATLSPDSLADRATAWWRSLDGPTRS